MVVQNARQRVLVVADDHLLTDVGERDARGAFVEAEDRVENVLSSRIQTEVRVVHLETVEERHVVAAGAAPGAQLAILFGDQLAIEVRRVVRAGEGLCGETL